MEGTQSACSDALTLEAADVRAYHQYLNSTEALENVFSTTVILHNLVSSSLATEYQRHESPVLLCVEQALALIPAEMQPAHKPTAPTLPEGVQLPGVGLHRLIDCS